MSFGYLFFFCSKKRTYFFLLRRVASEFTSLPSHSLSLSLSHASFSCEDLFEKMADEQVEFFLNCFVFVDENPQRTRPPPITTTIFFHFFSRRLFFQDFVRREVEKAFSMIDRDGSGQLSKDELRGLIRSIRKHEVSEVEVNELIDKMDKDCDGQISKNEFTQAITVLIFSF